MHLDRCISTDLEQVGTAAAIDGGLGFSCLWLADATHDPTLAAAMAARHAPPQTTIGIQALHAFARNPMTVATTARDLNELCGGRLLLGLTAGTEEQVARVFSCDGSQPTDRLRDFVLAVRHLWSAWRAGTPVDFEGDFYKHDFSPPFFVPEPGTHPPPPVFLSVEDEAMAEVAGEVADGIICSVVTTTDQVHELLLPAAARGATRARPQPEAIEVSMATYVVTGADEEAHQAALRMVRRHLVLQLADVVHHPHLTSGPWAPLALEVGRLVASRRFQAAEALIDDTVVDAFAVVGPPSTVVDAVRARYEGVADRVSLLTPGRPDLAPLRLALSAHPALRV